MRIEVDPEALVAAGRQMASLGSQLGRLSDALGAALAGGIASGTDPAGLNFGMKYGRQAQDFAEAVAEAADAFTTVGLLVEATGINYRNADAASTIGGSGPGAGVSGQPGKTMPAHVPPGPNGVTVPAPSKWHLVQPFLQALPMFGLLAGTAMTWPSGHSAMMGITAMQWRNFATGFALIEPQLGGIRSVVGAQSIPESGAMVAAVDDLGAAISSLADVASTMAQTVSDFAATVQATQDAIRRLLDRLSISGLWDTVTGLLTGEGDDILREVARDIGTVLENFQQQVQGIVGLLDELTILIGDAATAFQKWIRPVLVEHFGDGVGNALADAVTLYTDIQVGAATGLIGTVAGAVALADPDTWKGMAELAASVVQDPSSAPDVLANMGKEFLAWDKWSGEHPGRAAGEAAFNIGSLFVPGGALTKTGSIARGLNLSRRMLDEGRLPELGEIGDWARVPGGAPRVPEVPAARPGATPPASPPRPDVPVGAGPGRAVEPPPGGRPPTPGAEGGAGQRAPVEQSGRGAGDPSSPGSGANAVTPTPTNESTHSGGSTGPERSPTPNEQDEMYSPNPQSDRSVANDVSSQVADELRDAFMRGAETHELTKRLADLSTHYISEPTHLSSDIDRVVLGKWDGQDGGYIGEARKNGGIYYDTGPNSWEKLTSGLSQPDVTDLGWQVNEEFLRTQMENGVARIEYVLDRKFESLEQVVIKRPGSFSAMEIEFLTENAPRYGYHRVGNTWVRGGGE